MPGITSVSPDEQVSKLRGLLSQVVEQVGDLCDGRTKQLSEHDALKDELDMAKRAYKQLQEERRAIESSLHMEKVSLQERILCLEQKENQLDNSERRVVCLIDGDGLVFHRDLIKKGRDGGLKAVRQLTDAIRDDMKDSPGTQLWTYCFMNRPGLSKALGSDGATLDAFLSGFNQAGNFSFAVDIGSGKEAADSRIRALLESQARSLLTLRIYFGGCQDGGYAPTLDSLITQKLGNKLTLLPGHAEMAMPIRRLALPTLEVPDLFEPAKVVSPGVSTAAAWPVLQTPTGAINALTTPKVNHKTALFVPVSSKTETPTVSPKKVKLRYLEQGVPPWKNNPPPCRKHYISENCPFADTCIYGHCYTLRPGEKEKIAAGTKMLPCDYAQAGVPCPSGKDCIYGH